MAFRCLRAAGKFYFSAPAANVAWAYDIAKQDKLKRFMEGNTGKALTATYDTTTFSAA